MTASTWPTRIKINLWLFLFTKHRHGSMKSCLPFLLVQIQHDYFLWRPQWLPCPPWSKKQDYCMSRQIPADATGTKWAVCTECGLTQWRGPTVKMWTCGRVKDHQEMLPAWPSMLSGHCSLPHPDPYPPSLPFFAVSWDCVMCGEFQARTEKIMFLLIPQTGQTYISVALFTTMPTPW